MPRKGQIYREALSKPGEKTGRKYGAVTASIREYSSKWLNYPVTVEVLWAWLYFSRTQIDGALRGMVRSGSAVIVKRGKPGRTGQRTVYQLIK